MLTPQAPRNTNAIRQADPHEIIETYRNLRKQINNALYRMERVHLTDNAFYRRNRNAYMPARDLTETEMRKAIRKMRRALDSKLSTVRGVRSALKRQDITVAEQIRYMAGDETNYTDAQRKRIMRNADEQALQIRDAFRIYRQLVFKSSDPSPQMYDVVLEQGKDGTIVSAETLVREAINNLLHGDDNNVVNTNSQSARRPRNRQRNRTIR